MKIIMNQEQYQELMSLVDIFENMFFDGQKVQCFDLLKKLVDQGLDTDSVSKEKKLQMRAEMQEGIEWLESLCVKIEYRDQYLSYFS